MNDYDLSQARKSSTFYVIRYRHKLCEEERHRCSLAIMKTDSIVTIDGKTTSEMSSFERKNLCLGVVNSISQACGKLSFNIWHYLHTPKEGRIAIEVTENKGSIHSF